MELTARFGSHCLNHLILGRTQDWLNGQGVPCHWLRFTVLGHKLLYLRHCWKFKWGPKWLTYDLFLESGAEYKSALQGRCDPHVFQRSLSASQVIIILPLPNLFSSIPRQCHRRCSFFHSLVQLLPCRLKAGGQTGWVKSGAGYSIGRILDTF